MIDGLKMEKFVRSFGREFDSMRDIKITPDYQEMPLASVLIETGKTRVICALSAEEKVPPFINEPENGWLTAEYMLLPSSTQTRSRREAARGKISGRTAEIQRIIGRCLRSVTMLDKIGERTLYLDCDVIQADGGTRTAALTGAFAALALGLSRLRKEGKIEGENLPLRDYLAAVSVGMLEGKEKLLDLDYFEDSRAAVDLNVIRTGNGRYVEIQGGAEKMPFNRAELDELLLLADKGIDELIQAQKRVLGDSADLIKVQ